jgi:dTMP kinase
MRSGIFITFEGPDGSGKTTQIQRLSDYLQEQGQDIFVTREPGGTDIGEKIREIVLDPIHKEMDKVTEALLYAASRAQHVAEVIKPTLEAGKTVICDRFMDSSIAYQGYGRSIGEPVRIINEIAVSGLIPDLTFLLLVDPDEGKRRISSGTLDRLELEKIEYHREVYKGYLELAKQHPNRILLIEGNRGIEEISSEITHSVERFLQEASEH